MVLRRTRPSTIEGRPVEREEWCHHSQAWPCTGHRRLEKGESWYQDTTPHAWPSPPAAYRVGTGAGMSRLPCPILPYCLPSPSLQRRVCRNHTLFIEQVGILAVSREAGMWLRASTAKVT